MLAGYAMPVLCKANGRTDLVVAGTGKLQGYDPATGKELWTCNTLLRTMMTTPVVKDGVIYVAVQSYGDCEPHPQVRPAGMARHQPGRQAGPDRGRPRSSWTSSTQSDKNKDGFLAGDELDNAFQHPTNMVGGGNIIQAIKGGGTGRRHQDAPALEPHKSKCPSNLSSPLVVGNRLYVVKTGGLSSCFDAATGKPSGRRQRLDNLGDYLRLAGGRGRQDLRRRPQRLRRRAGRRPEAEDPRQRTTWAARSSPRPPSPTGGSISARETDCFASRMRRSESEIRDQRSEVRDRRSEIRVTWKPQRGDR